MHWPNSLSEINEAHKTSTDQALECGRLLLEAQVEVQTAGGNWTDWVKDNLAFGVRQAGNYLKFAKEVTVKPGK